MNKYDVCVFGGCSLDKMYYQKPTGEYSDIPDVIIPGGKGANQAVAASRAGANTVIITRLGKDETGEKILNQLAYNKVSIRAVELVPNVINDTSDIYINIKDADNDIRRKTGAIDSFTVDMIEKNEDILLQSKIIVCQLKCPKEVTVALIEFCHKHNKLLILTPCRPNKLSISEEGNKELIDKISLITCNKKECETIFGTSDIEACVKQYPNKLIVTLGKEGLMYFNGERIIKMPSIPVDRVVDTTGAGDTLNGNLACFISQGLDLQHALRKAMYASTMKIQVKTAQDGMPYPDELEEFITKSRSKSFEYKEELDLILSVARDLFKTEINVEVIKKSDGTFVTTKDLEIEDTLVRLITENYPTDNFLTEERHTDGVLLDRTWVIDPIDGTNHFMKGSDFYGMQLAFYDRGETQFSVIYIPKTDRLYYAFKNGGAYLNNNKIIFGEPASLEKTIVEFSGALYRCLEEKEHYIKKMLNPKTGKPYVLDFRYLNSSCIAFSELVSGKTDALIVSTVKLWDIMPGMFLCKEAGILSHQLDFGNHLILYYRNPEVLEMLFEK